MHHPIQLFNGFDGGIGLAAFAVPAMCMIGGYAIAGRGPAAVRALCALLALSAIPVWALTAEDVGGPSFTLGDPHGAWAAVLYWGLLATFSMAASIPHRRPRSALEPFGAVRGSITVVSTESSPAMQNMPLGDPPATHRLQ